MTPGQCGELALQATRDLTSQVMGSARQDSEATAPAQLCASHNILVCNLYNLMIFACFHLHQND